MKKLLVLIVGLIIIHHYALCQKEASNWNFGRNAAMTFNTPDKEPVFVNGSQLNSWEGCATISDSEGNLLFYTNGVTVWNKNNAIMDGGTGLLGDNSATQSSVAFQHPTQAKMYYIFTVGSVESNTKGFNYSFVDMNANGGLGKVITKNVKIHDKPIERIAVIPHANKKAYWVIVHITGTTEYLAYKVDEFGVATVPIVSNGTLKSTKLTGHTLKASLDGTRIASTHSFASVIELFDFDAFSGKMTLTHNLLHPSFTWPYGVEFSPDGKLLYASLFFTCRLVQFDVTLKTAEQILNSMVVLGENKSATFYFGTIQLGINGKIYVAQDDNTYLGVISKPNQKGEACDFVEYGFRLLSGSRSGLGLPSFVQAFFAPKEYCEPKGDDLIINGDFEVSPSNFTSTLSLVDANAQFQTPSTYIITKVNPINTNDPCSLYGTINKFMFVHTKTGLNEIMKFDLKVEKNIEYILSFDFVPIDDKVFSNLRIDIDGEEIASDFIHSDGLCQLINYKFTWNSKEKEDVELTFKMISSSPEKFALDNISFRSCECSKREFESSEHQICYGKSVKLEGNDNQKYIHKWEPNFWIDNPNSPTPTVSPTKSTIYLLKLTDRITGCEYFDTVKVEVIPAVEIEILGDNLICVGDSTELSIEGNLNSIIWSTGDTTLSIIVSTPGTYEVSGIDSNGCEHKGQIQVKLIESPGLAILGPVLVCFEEEYELEVNLDAFGYLWSTGDTTKKIKRVGAGFFTVLVTIEGGCIVELSIDVGLKEDGEVRIRGPFEVCIEENFELEALILADKYIWSTGDSTKIIKHKGPGVVNLEVVTKDGCRSIGSYEIKLKPDGALNIIGKTEACLNEDVTLMTDFEGVKYNWSTGDTTKQIIHRGPGTISVEVIDSNGCRSIGSFVIELIPDGIVEIIGPKRVCIYEEFELIADIDGEKYIWSTGDTTKKIKHIGPGKITVEVITSEGCVSRGGIEIELIPDADIDIFGPTSICEGENSIISISGNFQKITWSTGDTTEIVTITKGGTYNVQAIDIYGCRWIGSIKITEIPKIHFEEMKIDLGELCIFETNQSNYEIVNSNDFAFTISKIMLQNSSSGQIELQYNQSLPLVLNNLQTLEFSLKFSPLVSAGKIYDTITVFISEPCYTEFRIPITGTVIKTETKVWIADTTVAAGEYICIPIHATMFCEEFITGEFKYRLVCDLSKSFFEPDSVASGTMVVDDKNLRYYIIEIEDIAILEESNNIVNYICGTVLSPDSTKFSVNINDFEWTGFETETKMDNGLFDVEYCVYTIRQLIYIKLTSITLKPNVTEGAFTANVVSSEVGNFNIIITNSIGNEVYRRSWVRNSKSEPEENEMLIDLSEYPSGIYNVIMISPWSTKTEKVMLVK
ncbi:MAG: hypothetical protein CVV22_02195 [Ignavibacteriae bacterium HGW-Ignavibacteriae-1]|jgi:hypothetical protein|nr:MAG: hypothetical protein CVV22_02195 [Ignavibacteriae bacterium HGW-Ignavibacteriae-1]